MPAIIPEGGNNSCAPSGDGTNPAPKESTATLDKTATRFPQVKPADTPWRSGIRHDLFDDSPDMQYLEIVSPAEFKSVDAEAVCEVPPPTPWK